MLLLNIIFIVHIVHFRFFSEKWLNQAFAYYGLLKRPVLSLTRRACKHQTHKIMHSHRLYKSTQFIHGIQAIQLIRSRLTSHQSPRALWHGTFLSQISKWLLFRSYSLQENIVWIKLQISIWKNSKMTNKCIMLHFLMLWNVSREE